MVKELAKGSTMDDELKDIRSLAGSILDKIKSILVARGIPKCTNSKDILDEQYTRLKLISTRLYQAKEELDEFWHIATSESKSYFEKRYKEAKAK